MVVDSLRAPARRKRLAFRRKRVDRREDSMMPISLWYAYALWYVNYASTNVYKKSAEAVAVVVCE